MSTKITEYITSVTAGLPVGHIIDSKGNHVSHVEYSPESRSYSAPSIIHKKKNGTSRGFRGYPSHTTLLNDIKRTHKKFGAFPGSEGWTFKRV